MESKSREKKQTNWKKRKSFTKHLKWMGGRLEMAPTFCKNYVFIIKFKKKFKKWALARIIRKKLDYKTNFSNNNKQPQTSGDRFTSKPWCEHYQTSQAPKQRRELKFWSRNSKRKFKKPSLSLLSWQQGIIRLVLKWYFLKFLKEGNSHDFDKT